MHRGFIFSMDALMAFSIITITILTLFVIEAYPKSFFSNFEQDYYMAKDNLQILYELKDADNIRYTTHIFNEDGIEYIHNITEKLIPKSYGFKFEKCILNYSSSPPKCDWQEIYPNGDASYSHRSNSSRVSASTQIFVMDYSIPPDFGQSPGCMISCHGINNQCTTPCGDVTSQINEFDSAVGLLRLTVFS